MFKEISQRIFASPEFERLSSSDPTPAVPLRLAGLAGSLRAFAAVHLFQEFRTQILVVVEDREAAEKLRDDCAQLIDDASVRIFAYEPHHLSQTLDMSAPIGQVESLKALSAGSPGVYITHGAGLSVIVPEKESFAGSIIDIGVRTEVPFTKLLEDLTARGFERKPLVETYGDVAVRGGIVDIFPFIGEHPIRIEFWGDTVESVREFDVLSQRSIRDLERVSIVPETSRLLGLSDGPRRTLTHFLPPDAVVLMEEPEILEKEIRELESEGTIPEVSFEETLSSLSTFRRFVHSAFRKSGDDRIIDFNSVPQPPCNSSVKVLVERIGEFQKLGYHTVVTSDTEEESARIRELIEEEQAGGNEPAGVTEEAEEIEEENAVGVLEAPAIRYIAETVHGGFIFPSARLAVFTEHEIFNRIKRRRVGRIKRFKGLSSKEVQTLQRGDYVVHVDHGIGKFRGLQKIKIRGHEQEVARLEYAEEGTLFVNLNYINRIQKYASSEGHVPRLNKLGSGEWDRLKRRAKKKIKEIARELILLYAKRKHEPGFAFSPDSHWQKELEASFMFEDTPDQASTTASVKKDMENPAPMDRLVCGDVGFGKTEIAVRAAFKAVLDNKQVAILVPTTILAEQHYHTFLDRLSRYPVRIESISRFKPAVRQREILSTLKEGGVDIIIGTHRLLSKDVAFKNLGLLVIDEEQRFGVAAKEKLRKLRAAVDTLTLTATPIPRTLHFSLMGARDLSIINTPPRNRLSITTEIAQYDKGLVREAILRELHRGGQIYVVNDRIESLDRLAASLQEAAPQARYRIAHGQMKGHELERVMMDFLERKFDVLVTTKIIESGLDIPNVNTIVINRADRFGMAELYQLRGRVGRSNVQAYAYLLVPPVSSIPKQTLRRLQAIEEFTELGSGFNLAMRDLEIRGAGNMLGAEQSGFIMEMGFELYTRTLEEAVAELKEEEFSGLFAERQAVMAQKAETIVEADVDAYLPDFYVENDSERLDLYRRLARVGVAKDIDEIRLELGDRFGSPPEEVENLLALAHLKLAGVDAGFRKIDLDGAVLRLSLPPEEEKSFYEGGEFQRIMATAGESKQWNVHLRQERKHLFLQASLSDQNGADRLRDVHVIISLFSRPAKG